jgi:hypothetical protein
MQFHLITLALIQCVFSTGTNIIRGTCITPFDKRCGGGFGSGAPFGCCVRRRVLTFPALLSRIFRYRNQYKATADSISQLLDDGKGAVPCASNASCKGPGSPCEWDTAQPTCVSNSLFPNVREILNLSDHDIDAAVKRKHVLRKVKVYRGSSVWCGWE